VHPYYKTEPLGLKHKVKIGLVKALEKVPYYNKNIGLNNTLSIWTLMVLAADT